VKGPAVLLQRWHGRTKNHRYAVLALVVVVCVIVGIVIAVVRHSGDKHQAGRPTPLPNGSSVPSFGTAGTPTPAQRELLDQRAGFAGAVTGGAGGEVAHVSTDAQSGPGSLRDAVTGDAPRWVVFDRDMTIRLTTPLAVGSNKTVDGRGRRVEITGPGIEGLDLIGVSNVIIESLTLHDFGDVTKTAQNNQPDAVHLDHARGVWIDHCDLSMAGDKLIAVSNGSSGITASWNHFHDQEQVFQVGNQATADVGGVQTLTVEHNFFDHTGYRNPVVSYGRAHVYNNYFLDWRLYGVRSERTAQVYLQNNVFAAGANRRAAIATPHGTGCNDAKTRCDDRPGFLKAVGNLLLGGAVITDNTPQDVFDPSKFYRYTAEPATQALSDRIAAQVGPKS
jgi:pectate lyase